MCIRDSVNVGCAGDPDAYLLQWLENATEGLTNIDIELSGSCLLYTSDAADERSSVDLGGRRIIKKKNRMRAVADSIVITRV